MTAHNSQSPAADSVTTFPCQHETGHLTGHQKRRPIDDPAPSGQFPLQFWGTKTFKQSVREEVEGGQEEDGKEREE